MACLPLLAATQKRPLEALAEQARFFPLATGRSEESLRIGGPQRAKDGGGGGLQVTVDGGVLRGGRCGYRVRRRGAEVLAPSRLLLAQGPAFVRADPERPRKRVAPGIEFRCPRQHFDERRLGGVLGRCGPTHLPNGQSSHGTGQSSQGTGQSPRAAIVPAHTAGALRASARNPHSILRLIVVLPRTTPLRSGWDRRGALAA